ncbi:hypothetical protein HDE_07603 [Halotydeus destructor]|nr:hypothetical protein HDE_07603 [Halotydeus destructor]
MMTGGISLHVKLRAFWFCLCVLGNAYQIYTLSASYFSYDVSTTVRINFPVEFEPPASSLCFARLNMVRMDVAMIRWPDFKSRFGKEVKGAANMSDSQFKATLAKVPVNDKVQLSKYVYEDIKVEDAFTLTYDYKELFLYCRIIQTPSYSFDSKPCHIFFNISETFIGAAKCFTFKLKVPQVYNYLTVQRMKIYPGVTSIIVMKPYLRNITNDLLVYSHPSNTFAREGLSRYLFLTPLELFSMTYSTFTSKLLPAPYDTDCQNYTLSGYFDRGDCYETCVNKQSLDRLGKLAPGPVVVQDEFPNERMIDAATVIASATIRKSIFEINDDCETYCRKPDCESTYYVPSMMAAMEYDYPVVTTYVEQEPIINTVYEQKQSFIQYFTDLFSTLGFWIGTSGLTIFDIFWDLVTRKKKEKQDLGLPAVQITAIRKLQKDMSMVQEQLKKTNGQDYSQTYKRTGYSYGRSIKEYDQPMEPMFRTNFFRL